eukprot:CAMPEP_0115063284 /NCGR_PEP_ID=MMETSP0227-20121206/9025_1 /TAXON_ID=89957 /ORGANISM="Polarella glacialis, Strain CCMP 1383" /LENGTH=88 /DNA_ID=CAMNT_0002448775 /DNA_START=177 /DNA_END=443 /DNA_ORIENTATION=-
MSIYSYRLRQVVQDSFALFVDRISPRTSDDEALEDLQVAGGRGKMQCSDGILVDLVDEGTLLEQGGHTPRRAEIMSGVRPQFLKGSPF